MYHNAIEHFSAFSYPDVADLAIELVRQRLVHHRGTTVVGDTAWDMTAARRGGADAIGVLTGGWSREELLAAGARAVVEGLRELGPSDPHAPVRSTLG